MRLTRRQQEILDFLRDNAQDFTHPPTLDELCAMPGLSSRGSLHKHVQALIASGFVEPMDGQHRGIRLIRDDPADDGIPFLGTIAAGRPIEAVPQPESVQVPPQLSTDKPCYVLKVRGDSMCEAGILDGDYVIIEQRETARIGVPLDLTMAMAGFCPQGGGELQARIPGGARLTPLKLTERGPLRAIRGLSAVANLPRAVAERQRSQALRRLRILVPHIESELQVEEFPAASRGTVLLLLAECEPGRACCFALDARGKRAERVADEAVDALAACLRSDGAVDPWLADQLLLPLAMADGPSELRTREVTAHLLTNAEVIRLFLPVEIRVGGPLGGPATVQVRPAPSDPSGPTPGTEDSCSAGT